MFGEAFNEAETYQGAVPSDAYLRSLLSKQHFIAIAAIKGDGTVAALAAYELEKFEQDRREIYIYDIAVSMGHRRKGIATALLDELRRIARERKAYVIFVQADIGDEPAIRLLTNCWASKRTCTISIFQSPRESNGAARRSRCATRRSLNSGINDWRRCDRQCALRTGLRRRITGIRHHQQLEAGRGDFPWIVATMPRRGGSHLNLRSPPHNSR